MIAAERGGVLHFFVARIVNGLRVDRPEPFFDLRGIRCKGQWQQRRRNHEYGSHNVANRITSEFCYDYRSMKFCVIAFSLSLAIGHAQTPGAAPKFEVASIRLSDCDFSKMAGVRPSPGRINIKCA